MKYSIILFLIVLFGCSTNNNLEGTEKDRNALEKTSIGIVSAFAKQDIPTILSYHHPDIRKALGFNHIVKGSKELEKDLKNTFSNVSLKWLDNHVESLIFHENTAIEMTAYTIQATPKDGSGPTIFKGRAMIVYIRDKRGPDGWLSLRELIQPESTD